MVFEDEKKRDEAEQASAFNAGQSVRRAATFSTPLSEKVAPQAFSRIASTRAGIADIGRRSSAFVSGLAGVQSPAIASPVPVNKSGPDARLGPRRLSSTLTAAPVAPKAASTPPIGVSISDGGNGFRPFGVGPDGIAKSLDIGPDGKQTIRFTGTPSVVNARARPGTVGAQSFGTSGQPPSLFRPAADSLSVAQDRQAIAGLQNNPQDLARTAINQQTGLTRSARAASTSVLNPGSAAFELQRRLQNQEISGRGNGSPSQRARAAQPFLNALAAEQGAIAAGQQAGNVAVNSGLGGAIAGETGQQNIRGQAVLSRIQQQGAERLQQIQADAQANAPVQITDTNGNVLLRRNNVAEPVIGPDGQSVRAAGGQTDPRVQSALIKSAADQLGALALTPTPDPEKDPAGYKAYQDRVAVLQAQAAGGNVVVQGGGQGLTSGTLSAPPDAVAMLKANPQLAAQFDAKYGQGASASVLGK